MTTNPWIVVLVTVGIMVLSAFFVVIEFALLGARRHRLEDAATTSRSARAALWGINELTIMMAGSQLGVTACTFALGAVTQPAVNALVAPMLADTGLPQWLASGASFIVALLVVTFLHLVVGEMAPKSWTIARPERAAMVIGLPARGFVWLLSPLLHWLNRIANRLVAASGVEPVDRAAVGRDAATIRSLVEHSAEVGSLEAAIRTPLSGAIDFETLHVEDLVSEDTLPATIAAADTVADLQDAARRTGHMRILIDGGEQAPGVIHVRDTLFEDAHRSVADLARPAFTVDSGTSVDDALTQMQRSSEQLAVVMDGSEFLGVITFNDAVTRLLPSGGSAG